MENATEPVDNPLQKTEVTTSITENVADIQELDNATPKQSTQSVSIEDSKSDLDGKNQTQNLQGEIISSEMKLEVTDKDPSQNFDHIEQQLRDKFTKSSVTVEESVIAPNVNLDQRTEPVINKSLDNHPYKDVLLRFEPSSELLSFVNNLELPKSLEQTPLVDIDNKDDLEGIISSLKNEKEIGVDVEWSDHGYEAVTCLVQLSTKDKDYIIDAIALKHHMLLLNEIFVDPKIVKIFHAATNDLKWLQQNLDVFVVNMFDTQRAMRVLGYNKLGLDVALQEYKVVKDKSMQRADFRKRPLPPKYKDYARTDSHFLIHMYQKLKNKLIESDSLVQVLNECHNDCKVVHAKIEDAPYVSVREEILKIHDRQLVALEKLNKWRKRVAQYADVNAGVVLSKNNMKSLALELPGDAAAVLRICINGYVKEHLQEIIDILLAAKGQPKGSNFQQFGTRGGFGNKRKIDQTEFGRNDNLRGGPKMAKTFYGNYSSRGGSKRNRQNDLVDLRNTLQKNTSNRNKNNRRGFRRY